LFLLHNFKELLPLFCFTPADILLWDDKDNASIFSTKEIEIYFPNIFLNKHTSLTFNMMKSAIFVNIFKLCQTW